MPLTDTGAVVLAKLLIGEAQTPYTTANARIGVGNSAAAFAKTHTDLQATSPNKLRKQMDSGFPTRSGNVLTFIATFAPAEAVWTWNEWGVFNAATLGEMLNRKVEAIGPKTSSQTWQISASVVVTAESTTIGEVLAASASLAHVQAAVDEAVDGDTVLIPDGVATWTSGITTTKQIIIRAQNYTPTPAGTAGAGTMTRNVTITNGTPLDSGTALFDLTSGNNFHCGVGGIRFNETGPVSGAPGPHIRISGSGSKVPLIFDCAFQIKDRISGGGVGSELGAAIVVACKGGVMWNCVLSGEGFNTNPGNVGPFNACIAVKKSINTPTPPAWTTASTMGTLDTGGVSNFYMEDTTAHIVAACPDVDEHGRAVIRHCAYKGSGMVMHGFTSAWGGRHVEIYDSEFTQVDVDDPGGSGGLNPSFGRNSPLYAWCRAGTMVMTNNSVSNEDIGYGSNSALVMGDNTEPSGSYLIPRQPGCGHNGSAYVSDPIYVWNQTGGNAYNVEVTDQIPAWSTVIQQDRDYFVNAGAKPGYSKFTYPHPLRSEI